MPIGILFWILWILCAIALFTGYAVAGVHASSIVFMVLFLCIGWKIFGAPLQ